MQPLHTPLQSTRFQILRSLGEGGFGVVYQAYDQERKIQVALKTIKQMSPEALYRLKQEFRVLADIAHPNLVRLYELMYDGRQWFFTMEMVEGLPLTEYVRADPPEDWARSSSSLNRFLRSAQVTPEQAPRGVPGGWQEERRVVASTGTGFPQAIGQRGGQEERQAVEAGLPGFSQEAATKGSSVEAKAGVSGRKGPRRGTVTAPLFQESEGGLLPSEGAGVGGERQGMQPRGEGEGQGPRLRAERAWEGLEEERGRLGEKEDRPGATRRGSQEEGGQEKKTEGKRPLLYDPERLQRSFLQLVEGLQALHQAGKTHRDIKPSNILVTKEGRVVILDFGLAADAGGEEMGQSIALAGTPMYMPPEQGRREAPSFAGDWYSVGVILYEALVGVLPFVGQSVAEIVASKERGPTQRPREIQPKIPEDLESLCLDLLHPEARKRPAVEEILQRLGDRRASSGTVLRGHQGLPLIGRTKELLWLEEGVQVLGQGRPSFLDLRGESGVGKSKLLRWYLKRLQKDDPAVVVLSSRCHQQESLPYKAVDGVIDGLSRFLRRQPISVLRTLLPESLDEIRLLFPVLWGLPEVESKAGGVPSEAQEIRRRAWGALREIIRRLALRQPLIVWIDDAQWGDLDSGAMLAEILRPPAPPALFLILSSRSDRPPGPFLAALGGEEDVFPPPFWVRRETLSPLSLSEAEELAKVLLRQALPRKAALASWVARESGGNPFVLELLARYVEEMEASEMSRFLAEEQAKATREPKGGERRGPWLDSILASLLASLSPQDREILATLAVAGKPIRRSLLQRLVPWSRDLQEALQRLRSRSVIRLWNYGDLEEAEVCHEEIGKASLSFLGEGRVAESHHRLAAILEEEGEDPEIVAYHYARAGEEEKRIEYLLQASRLAVEGMAFAHAVELLREIVAAISPEDSKRGGLLSQLGHALSNLGRGQESAQAYLEAVRYQEDLALRIELQRRAAIQYFRCGKIEEGLEVLKGILAPLGLKLAKTPYRALASFLWRRLRLALRGRKSQRRKVEEIPIRELLRIDTCRVVAMELGLVDSVRAADFQALHLQLALDAGEEYRLALALALEIPYASAQGGRAAAKTERMILQSITLAKRIQHPHALGTANLTAGVACFVQGRWRRALEFCKRAIEILQDRCQGVAWELANAQMYALNSWLFMGDYQSIEQQLPSLLHQARERDDLYAEVFFRLGIVSRCTLLKNRPQQALDEVRDALGRWPKRGFQLQEYIGLILEGEIALFRGQARPTLEMLDQRWSEIRKSLFLYAQFNRLEFLLLRARLSISSAASVRSLQPSEVEAFLRRCRADVKAVQREGTAWASALIPLLSAGIASLKGGDEETIESLIMAETALEEVEMSLHKHAARWLLGHLLQGEEGRILQASATAFLRLQGVESIPMLIRMLIPGHWSL